MNGQSARPSDSPSSSSPSPEPLRTICVFAGASRGASPKYAEAARALGRTLVDQGCGVVYGGGARGLMGVLADEVLGLGGTVIGVIPERLAKRELAHQGLTRLEVVHSMHERKLRMATLADAFIALPGGIGTFEEVLEVATWTQLRIHDKPVALFNTAGYYDGLMAFLDHATREQFIAEAVHSMLLADDDPRRLLERLHAWKERPSRS